MKYLHSLPNMPPPSPFVCTFHGALKAGWKKGKDGKFNKTRAFASVTGNAIKHGLSAAVEIYVCNKQMLACCKN